MFKKKMKETFINPTVSVMAVEVEEQILAGSGGKIVAGGTATGEGQNTGNNGHGLARNGGQGTNPNHNSISAYELN